MSILITPKDDDFKKSDDDFRLFLKAILVIAIIVITAIIVGVGLLVYKYLW